MTRGRLIRPRRLRRWLVVVSLALAVFAAGILPGGAAAGAREAAKRVAESAPRIVQSASEALRGLGDRIAPAVDAALACVRELGAAGDAAASDADSDPGDTAAEDAGEPGASGAGASGESAEISPILRRNADSLKKLALTFDDGPHPTETAAILDLLAEYGVKATFFVIGENAAAHPEIIAREIAEGHEVENHTMTHRDLSALSQSDAEREIADAESAIRGAIRAGDPSGADDAGGAGNAIGEESAEGSRFLRPPGGAANAATRQLAARLGMRIVLWSVDTRDWAHTGTDAIVRKVRAQIKGGDVILFHDYISGETHTLEALETLIPELIGEGYEFVTVSELFEG